MLNATVNSHSRRARGAIAIVAAMGLALAGCGGEEGKQTGATAGGDVKVNTPSEIVQVSADNYNDNANGVITGETLSRWLNDWENERPAGVTGRLIIMQQGSGPEGAEFVKSLAPHVYTYEMTISEIAETRTNGVITTPTIVASGPTMDTFLKKYAIDPREDMVVCARGSGSILNQARCWYTLRYWGVPQTNIAYLNGSFDWMVNPANPHRMQNADFASASAIAPNNGRVSVRDMPEDNFALIATIEDMLDIVTPTAQNNTSDGVLIWDARGLNQYSAGEAVEMGQSGCATAYCGPVSDYMTTFQNGGSRQGHPNGTLQLQFTRMYVGSEGNRLKDKSELQAYFDGYTDADGVGFVDFTYQPVGAGMAYQPGDTMYVYCETTQRAQVTGLVSAAVLGLPTRYYDGAMVEWNSLSNIVASDGLPILPADSPWRADMESISFFRPSNDATKINTRQIDDAYAARSNANVVADRTYKYSLGGGSTSGGGGIALPANPCGG